MLVQTELAFFFEVTRELCKRLELPKQKVVEYLSLINEGIEFEEIYINNLFKLYPYKPFDNNSVQIILIAEELLQDILKIDVLRIERDLLNTLQKEIEKMIMEDKA